MSSDPPGPAGQDPERPDHGDDRSNPFAGTPFEAFFVGMGGADQAGQGGQAGPGDPSAMFEQFRRMQNMLSAESGPINWELAKDTAATTIRQAGDASLTANERAEVTDTARLAQHWLDEVTELPASTATPQAWNRAEWLERTLPTWRKLVDPLAANIVSAMSNALPEQAKELSGPLGELMEKAGGLMFGIQVGQGLGRLATEVLSAADTGIALGPAGIPAMIPANVREFGAGLSVPEEDVRLYLTLRECAHQRLAHHAPWLAGHLIAAVEDYTRGMRVNTSKLEGLADMTGTLDPSNPEALSEALSSGLLQPEETEEQKAALLRLETMLALVEGWVDDVVAAAAKPRMPSATQLQEAIRRRRAEGGPAEQTFNTLVGLELRPRRLRDAAALWAVLRESGGITERDSLWSHPDLLPSATDLDDPLGFAESHRSAEPFDLGTLHALIEDEQRTQSAEDATGTGQDTDREDRNSQDDTGPGDGPEIDNRGDDGSRGSAE